MADYWDGSRPTKCQICEKPLERHFVDGWTARGWALMDDACHKQIGRGLGQGNGQRYERRGPRWIKIEG